MAHSEGFAGSINTTQTRRRGRSRAGTSQPTSATRRRSSLRANAARNSNITVAGRRQRRSQMANSLTNRRINAVQSLDMINNYFTDCKNILFGCQQQLDRLGRIVSQIFQNTQLPLPSNGMNRDTPIETQLFGAADNGEMLQDDYQYRGELPVLLQNVRLIAEDRGEAPLETLAHLVSRRNTVEVDDELPRDGLPLQEPTIAEVNFQGNITITQDSANPGLPDAGDPDSPT